MFPDEHGVECVGGGRGMGAPGLVPSLPTTAQRRLIASRCGVCRSECESTSHSTKGGRCVSPIVWQRLSVYLPFLLFVIATHLALACSAVSLPAFTAAKSFFLISASFFLEAAESVPFSVAPALPIVIAFHFAAA